MAIQYQAIPPLTGISSFSLLLFGDGTTTSLIIDPTKPPLNFTYSGRQPTGLGLCSFFVSIKGIPQPQYTASFSWSALTFLLTITLNQPLPDYTQHMDMAVGANINLLYS